MKNISTILILIFLSSNVQAQFKKDVFRTSGGDLSITFLGHASLMMQYNGKVIYVDPVLKVADYTTLPKADLILVTCVHGDHFDIYAIDKIKKLGSMQVLLTQSCSGKYPQGIVIKNGESGTFSGIQVDAVPLYQVFDYRNKLNYNHPKGESNGYILHFGDFTVYVAGDTENIPEMKSLTRIDVAFLPMTPNESMTVEMATDAVTAFKPRILYPYKFRKTEVDKLPGLLVNTRTEVGIRDNMMNQSTN
jgi:L-ascorbate metabolism protein UlaG (beta-lactamase superfamily)